MASNFEQLLTGGHPNSLGNTLQVVEMVLANKKAFDDLLACYKSNDAVVRLRVSSAVKRVCKVQPNWVLERLDFLLEDVAKLDQPSAKWTLAQLFLWLEPDMNSHQREHAVRIMKHNLETEMDWIVQSTTAESLAQLAQNDSELKVWLIPQLERQTKDKHRSVARRAAKLLDKLQAT